MDRLLILLVWITLGLSATLAIGSNLTHVPQVVIPGTSNGLVAAGGLPGNTTGNSLTSPYVGYPIAANYTAGTITVGTTSTNLVNIAIPVGIWCIGGAVQYSGSSVLSTYVGGVITPLGPGNGGVLGVTQIVSGPTNGTAQQSVGLPSIEYVITTPTNFYLNAFLGAASDSGVYGTINAIRCG
jgi:hypothetical protein